MMMRGVSVGSEVDDDGARRECVLLQDFLEGPVVVDDGARLGCTFAAPSR